jgi:hypothetical protein
VTTQNIIQVGYYWQTMFKYSYEFLEICIPCENFLRKMDRDAMTLQFAMVEQPFYQFALYVIGQINPNSRKFHANIIAPTNYFTKSEEQVALINAY